MSHVAPHRWSELARGTLGEREARRMRGHADGCASCARARDRVTGAVQAFGDIARTPAPELGWDHIRARVYWATSSERRERERTQQMRTIRARRWTYALVPAAAAAVVGVVIAASMSSSSSAGHAPVTHAPIAAKAPAALPAPVALTGVVTLAQGDVAIDGAATAAKVLAHPIAAGSMVATRDGRVAVQFGGGSVFSVGPRSTLAVRRFDAGGIELALGDGGEVTVEVAPRAPGQRFLVTAGARTIEVRGTAFHVIRRGDTVDVACSHGLVAVRDRADPASGLASGPGSGPGSGDLLVPAGQGVVVADAEALADRAARPLDDAALAALAKAIGPRLPVWPDTAATIYGTSAPLAIGAPGGRAVRVDGVVVGAGSLAVRVMSGRHLVEMAGANGRFASGQWIEAGPGRADGRIDARVDLAPAADASIDSPGTSPRAARAARLADLARGLDAARVNACVRALAKQGLAGGTHVELEISVDADGAINMLNVGETDLPDANAACVRDAVAAVRFPRGPAATFSRRLDF